MIEPNKSLEEFCEGNILPKKAIKDPLGKLTSYTYKKLLGVGWCLFFLNPGDIFLVKLGVFLTPKTPPTFTEKHQVS